MNTEYSVVMIFDKYVSLPIFLIAFLVGFVFMYITPAERTKIVVYPTPDNKEQFLYMDKAENCYKFHQTEVQCPTDKNLIKEIPYQ